MTFYVTKYKMFTYTVVSVNEKIMSLSNGGANVLVVLVGTANNLLCL